MTLTVLLSGFVTNICLVLFLISMPAGDLPSLISSTLLKELMLIISSLLLSWLVIRAYELFSFMVSCRFASAKRKL